MNKNPLTTTVIIIAICDAYAVWRAAIDKEVSTYTVLAWLQGAALFILYFRRSKNAGGYLFYSLLPFYPIYFGSKAAGLNPPPATWQVYAIAFAIYAVTVALLWKQKRDYERYLSATERPASATG